MSLQKLLAQFDDYMRKIDQKAKNEDYKSVDATQKNLTDLKILLNDSIKIVNLNLTRLSLIFLALIFFSVLSYYFF